LIQTKPKLTLTRPKEPEFETNQRVRPARVKSAAELEEEMMAKMPKFKARPLNKKVLFIYLLYFFGDLIITVLFTHCQIRVLFFNV
jgi:hypothetical protein